MVVGQLERELLTSPVLTEQTENLLLGELSKISSLQILDATVTRPSMRSLSFSNVMELRVDGEHEAYFPREGIAFKKEKPVKAMSTEKYPQFLVVRGRVQPVYHVKNMYVELPPKIGNGIVEGVVTYVLGTTTFRHWAEYLSPEEQALLSTKGQLVGLSKIKKIYSISPDVTLVFPDGTVDAQSGRQVVEYQGRIPRGKLETTHTQEGQQLQLPDKFTVRGTFYLAGEGRFKVGGDVRSRYGGFADGALQYNKNKATLIADEYSKD